uniref:GON-4-like protein isoform X3 n=1 Tax=Podarcis muralis TaxID=64176 RepID=UPI00109F7606|nr:GON-4-like protein isoform X3 [Podarcis muralis]
MRWDGPFRLRHFLFRFEEAGIWIGKWQSGGCPAGRRTRRRESASDNRRAVARMSLLLKMLPCKKRRAVTADSEEVVVEEEDVQPVPMETPASGGINQLCGLVPQGQDNSALTEGRGPYSLSANTPACSSPPALPVPLSFLGDAGGEAAKSIVLPSRDAIQKGWPELSEASLRGGNVLAKAELDLCPERARELQDAKTSPSPELLVDKERKPKSEAATISLKPEPEWDVGYPPLKAPKAAQGAELLQEVKEEAEETGLFIPVEEREGGKRKRRKATKRKRDGKCQEEEEGPLACDLKLDDMLDRTLEDGAKQHNLTAVNVRNILHEVITNEHVVAMMKAAISETEDIPMFEPKMTRSKLKEVVEKGVVIPTWNISPIKKANEIKPPQFVDIPLEEDDSSDEEYQPEEEEEDETAEESLMESDVESTSSSPRGAKRSRSRRSSDMIETDEEAAMPAEAEKASAAPLQRHISAEVVPMGPPPPPKPKQSKDSTFMEKLHAVDEELASSPVCMDAFQPLEDSLIALRTRSKRPLKDVPLGQLEAELRAPDITPDMYDPNTADDEEWKRWLGGLMNDDVGNEDEADDDDDPEYNFLEDLDEPDTEDFRNDRAVRITKKEVNELMEELFETFQDEMGFSNVEDEGPEDEDSAAEGRPNFNTPQVLRFEEPLANLLNEQHRTVKEQLEQLRMKKSAAKLPQEAERLKLREKPVQTLVLDAGQKKRLQQQMQQHVQLLTQAYLLSSCNPSLSSEASTTRLFLTELDTFAQSSAILRQPLGPKFQTTFQPCNLKDALQLIKDFDSHVKIEWSPRKAVKKNVSDFVCLPKQVAWILATRRVFMYPELLPTCSLKAKLPRDKIIFTKGEDNLLALGLKHFEGTEFPKPLISRYLLVTKTARQLTVRIKNLNMNRVPDNILKHYKTTKQLPSLPKLCDEIQPGEWKPPVEQEEHRLPFWLKASLPSIQEALEQGAGAVSSFPGSDPDLGKAGRDPAETARDEKYPLRMPEGLQLILRPLTSRICRKAWRRQRQAAAKPLPVRPGLCLLPASTNHYLKVGARQPQPEAPPSKPAGRVPRLIQPAPLVQPLPGGIQHLSLLPATGSSASFDLQGVLSAPPHSGSSACLAAALPQNLVSSLPVAFQTKMIPPALPATKVRKPSAPRGYQKKKSPKAAPLFKPSPLLHPAPVIFTVPAGAVKVVGIANGCNVLHPLASSGAGSAAQPIPITTLLVNPNSFPCPLSQPLATSPAPSLVVTSNATSSPVPTKDSAFVSPPAGGITSPEPRETSPLVSAGEDSGQWSSDPDLGVQGETPIEGFGEPSEGKAADLGTPGLFSSLPEMGETVKVETEKPRDLPPVASPIPEELSSAGSPVREELVLELGQELDVEPTPEGAAEQKEAHGKSGSGQNEERGQGDGLQSAAGAAENTSSSSPEKACSSAAGGSDSGTALEKDLSTAGGRAVGGIPARQEASAGEKEGPEEEEEEDFDDFTQDEEDEEMSSASEESVLSVPELQETMEKLTWLASERRLSQEGESEEENSQEENSEPEEEEEEEEEEGEGENSENLQKEDEMADEVADPRDGPAESLALTCAAPEVEPSRDAPGESTKAPGKSRGSHRARAKRGRARASKDTSKLLLLYDEDILERDPLREQKDLAFAQAYLSRVREALRNVPGKYEEFLHIIYEFESNAQKQTAVDLYAGLRNLLREWPQLLTDFAAFLLPEQALECGLFEEQQAFEKSRKFLRQLEICFAENPSHHQKIIKVLQGCAECLPQEIIELKTQMWQLLKGHDHLQDEFSVFFDHLRPSANRLGDFEEINWTEEKEYEFDGFEEVSLPDVEEEEDPPKIHATAKNKKRKELGGQNIDKESEWAEGAKECCCSCHEGSSDLRLKRSKRRTCSHCSSSSSNNKAGDGKAYRNKDPQELTDSLVQRELSPRPEGKEPAEENLEQREDGEPPQSRMRTGARRADSTAGGSRVEGKLPLPKETPTEGGALPGPPCLPKASDPAKPLPPSTAASSTLQVQRGAPPKPHRPKSGSCHIGGESDAGLSPRSGEASSGFSGGETLAGAAGGAASPGVNPPLAKSWSQKPAVQSSPSRGAASAPPRVCLKDKELDRLPSSLDTKPKGRDLCGSHSKDLAPPKAGAANCGSQTPAVASGVCSPLATEKKGNATERLCASDRSELPAAGVGERAASLRGDELHQRAVEATVCAKNIKVSSTGEKVVLWTREADRVILTTCQERGAHPDTFSAISQQLCNKTAEEVAHRFRELMTLFHTACDVSSEDEEDGMSTSNTDQLSDKDPVLSEEEQEEQGF